MQDDKEKKYARLYLLLKKLNSTLIERWVTLVLCCSVLYSCRIFPIRLITSISQPSNTVTNQLTKQFQIIFSRRFYGIFTPTEAVHRSVSHYCQGLKTGVNFGLTHAG